MSDYRRMLEEGFVETNSFGEHKVSRLEFLGEYIFDFTTYDSGMAEQFASIALQVCEAISNKKTFEYITDPNQYRWFLIMVNMPFFNDKLDWGTSVRCAWWATPPYGKINYSSTGLWLDGHQLHEPMEFTREQWHEFVEAILAFAAVDGD